MEGVKFVPPGGHRACLSCSAAKAKCVFPDDGEVGDGSGIGVILGGTGGLGGPGGGDGQDTGGTGAAGGSSSHHDSSTTGAASVAGGSGSGSVEGVPAVPRCERCERLNRDCLLPTRPRKKRRVGFFKPGTTRAAMEEMAPKPAQTLSSPAAGKSGDTGPSGGPPKTPPSAASKGTSKFSVAVNPPTKTPKSETPLRKTSLSPSKPPPPTSTGAGSPARRTSTSNQPPQPQPREHLPPIASEPTLQQISGISGPALAQARAPATASRVTQQHPNLNLSTRTAAGPAPAGAALAAGASHLSPYSKTTIPPPPIVPSPLSSPPSRAQGPAPYPPLPPLAPPASPTAAGAQNPHQALINSVLHMREREAEELLRFYRDAYSRFNPYLSGPPPGVKAAELQTQKPFIWLNIVFVTSYHDFERQIRLAKAVIFYVTEQVFLNSVKSLELLQGILLFLNWFIAQNFVVPQVTNLIHVALALVNDLGLNKLEFSRTLARSPLDRYLSKSVHGSGLNAPEHGHTLDERRALAGSFCLSHAIAHSVTMMTPLQYTLQLEDTCRIFEANYIQSRTDLDSNAAQSTKRVTAPTTPNHSTISDYHLAVTVRLYYLISRVLQVQREADLHEGRFTVPVRTHIENFITELRRLWSSLPLDTQSDMVVKLLYHTAEIYIYELSVTSSTTPLKSEPAYSTSSRSSEDSAPTGTGKEMPIRCYMAVKSFFDVHLAIPVGLYHQLPMTIFAQIVHADLTLAKLTAFFRGNTRPVGVPPGMRLPPFSEVIEAVASRFARVRTVPHPLGYQVKNISYDAFAARLRSFKVLDLSGRRKAAGKAVAATDAPRRPSPQASTQAHVAHGSAALSTLSRSPPTSSNVLSIDRLIGTVPEAMVTDPDGGSSTGSGSGGGAYGGAEMDIEAESVHGDTPEQRSRGSTEEMELGEGAEVAEEGSDPEEQAEWWAWFGELQTSLLGGGPGSTTAAGSVSAPSVVAGSRPGGNTDDGSLSQAGPSRPGRTSSVTSIDSLLNYDQEPNYDAYVRQQQRRR